MYHYFKFTLVSWSFDSQALKNTECKSMQDALYINFTLFVNWYVVLHFFLKFKKLFTLYIADYRKATCWAMGWSWYWCTSWRSKWWSKVKATIKRYTITTLCTMGYVLSYILILIYSTILVTFGKDIIGNIRPFYRPTIKPVFMLISSFPNMKCYSWW